MSNKEDLFQAILDQPEDNNLRLVYADLLEEQGELDRAIFIRVQIELLTNRQEAHWYDGDWVGCKCEERWCILRRKEKELLDKYGTSWLPDCIRESMIFGLISPEACSQSLRWERGFVASVGFISSHSHLLQVFAKVAPVDEAHVWYNQYGYAPGGYEQHLSFHLSTKIKKLWLHQDSEQYILYLHGAVGLLSYANQNGWNATLKELVIDHSSFRAETYLLENLPKQQIITNGRHWDVEHKKDRRTRAQTLASMIQPVEQHNG